MLVHLGYLLALTTLVIAWTYESVVLAFITISILVSYIGIRLLAIIVVTILERNKVRDYDSNSAYIERKNKR